MIVASTRTAQTSLHLQQTKVTNSFACLHLPDISFNHCTASSLQVCIMHRRVKHTPAWLSFSMIFLMPRRRESSSLRGIRMLVGKARICRGLLRLVAESLCRWPLARMPLSERTTEAQDRPQRWGPGQGASEKGTGRAFRGQLGACVCELAGSQAKGNTRGNETRPDLAPPTLDQRGPPRSPEVKQIL